MRITKEGKLPEEREHNARCHNCGTEFAFMEGEAQLHSDQREGTWFTIPCPLCHKSVNGYPSPMERRW